MPAKPAWSCSAGSFISLHAGRAEGEPGVSFPVFHPLALPTVGHKKGGGPKGRRRKSRNAIGSVLDRRADKELPSQAVVGSREGVAVSDPEWQRRTSENRRFDIEDVVDATAQIDALANGPVGC